MIKGVVRQSRIGSSIASVLPAVLEGSGGITVSRNGNVTTIGFDVNSTTLEEALQFTSFWVTPESFGAVGNGSTDDTAAVSAAVAAVAGTNKKLIGRPDAIYKITEPIVVNAGPFDFDGNGCQIVPYLSGVSPANIAFLFTGANSTSAVSLASDAVGGDRTVVVASDPGFVVGGHIGFKVTKGAPSPADGQHWWWITEVTAIDGVNVSLADAVPPGFDILTATDTNIEVEGYELLDGVTFRNVRFDGSNITSDGGGGVNLNLCRRAKLEDLYFENFNAFEHDDLSVGTFSLELDSCYQCTVRDITSLNSGSQSVTDISIVAGSTRCIFDGLYSINGSGFAINFSKGAYHNVNNVHVSNAWFRGGKIQSTFASNFTNWIGSNAGGTQLGITLGSSYNNITNLILTGTGENPDAAGNGEGLWFSNSGENYNNFTNVAIRGTNLSFGAVLEYDIRLFANNVGNTFSNVQVKDFAHVADTGDNNVFHSINQVDYYTADLPIAVAATGSPPTFSTEGLPSAAVAGIGARAFVTDATATTFASVVSGSGGNKVPVWSDGTDWRIG